jgi:ABC-type cobalt transport system substrate-binding protein
MTYIQEEPYYAELYEHKSTGIQSRMFSVKGGLFIGARVAQSV